MIFWCWICVCKNQNEKYNLYKGNNRNFNLQKIHLLLVLDCGRAAALPFFRGGDLELRDELLDELDDDDEELDDNDLRRRESLKL